MVGLHLTETPLVPTKGIQLVPKPNTIVMMASVCLVLVLQLVRAAVVGVSLVVGTQPVNVRFPVFSCISYIYMSEVVYEYFISWYTQD